jgi:hypothetical protein
VSRLTLAHDQGLSSARNQARSWIVWRSVSKMYVFWLITRVRHHLGVLGAGLVLSVASLLDGPTWGLFFFGLVLLVCGTLAVILNVRELRRVTGPRKAPAAK